MMAVCEGGRGALLAGMEVKEALGQDLEVGAIGAFGEIERLRRRMQDLVDEPL